MAKGYYDKDEILIEIIRQLCLYGDFNYNSVKAFYPKLTATQFHRLTKKLRDMGLIYKEGKWYFATDKFCSLFNIDGWE